MEPVGGLFAVMVTAALLQASDSAPFNQTVFAVTVSSRLTGGKQQSLCAHIKDPTETASLRVVLDMKTEKTLVLEEDSIEQDFYRCIQLQVPIVLRRTVAFIEVTVGGGSSSLVKKTKVLIDPPTFIHVIQTDKPIYKPGQTVRFRMASMDSAFVPVRRVYKVVSLQDPSSNRVAQWLDQTLDGGFLDFSHPTIPEATEGSYTITAETTQGETTTHSFDIKQYVLPKYEVKVLLPAVIHILDQEVTIRICGKYTYGKPVIGSVKAEFCRSEVRSLFRGGSICSIFDLTTDHSGCVSQSVELSQFGLDQDTYADRFTLTAEMEEFGTGIVLKGSGSSSFSSDIRTVTFEDVPEAYKPGIPFVGKVKVVGPDNEAVANEPVFVSAGSSQKLTLDTDAKGVAMFFLDTSQWKDSVYLMASSRNVTVMEPYVPNLRRPEFRSAHHHVNAFYSKSSSFLKLTQLSRRLSCGKDAVLTAQYIIQGAELKKGQDVLDFFYLVMSRGAVVQHGRVPVNVNPGMVNKGEFSMSLVQMSSLAPVAQVVVYTLMPTGEAVADSLDFPIQLCLNNKVSLKFSTTQELPAQNTSLVLMARPGSLCSVRAIDQSVLLLKKEQELTVDYVFNQLPFQKLSGYDHEVDDDDSYPCIPIPEIRPVLEEEPELDEDQGPGLDPGRAKRSIFFERPEQKDDVYSVFKEVGIKLVTNSDVKKPQNCGIRFMYDEMDAPLIPMANMMPEGLGPVMRKEETRKESVRTFFPETWIWDLVTVGDGGSVRVEKTVPDTITKWAAGALCVSAAGVGVAPTAGLTAFQPFFVSLTLPYSVIRGEVFTLRATVFNYLSKCIMVEAVLEGSDFFRSRPCDGCLYTTCLCGEESRTFSWILTPTALGQLTVKVSAEALRTDSLCGNEVASVPDVGRVDTVVRSLLVEAEGTPQMVSHNALLCPAEGPVEKRVSLVMPEVMVAGSARGSVSVLGDLMGRAMKNVERLLAMPYGCGEQNMLLFTPNIFILNYLNSSSQLSPSTLERGRHFLERGYQRELTYKHDDGSYSAFGKSDPSGNTWLTAFVMKSFGGARPFIFVDEGLLEASRKWLSSHQLENGCILSVGKLFHNEMKGGVSDQVSLTAYITAAFLELDSAPTDPVVQKCLQCLKAAVEAPMENLYTTALLSYTFTLAQDQETRTRLIRLLDQKSTVQGGTRHWEREGASKKKLDSLEVEMTSYVLLALLAGPPIPDFGLDYATAIVRWLTQQQNPYGGFSSTQDTVVALQALARYGAATYSLGGSTAVTVTSSGFHKDFLVNDDNRLLYQEEPLSHAPGEYTIRAEGRRCVLAQISAHYNIPPPADFSAFNLSVVTVATCNASPPRLALQVVLSYQGRRVETNMVLINIKLLSGYLVDQPSLGKLKTDPTVKRVEINNGYIDIYLDGLKKEEVNVYPVSLEEDQSVRNLKAATIKVYDYYQTSDEASIEYTSSCAESDITNGL